MSIYWQLPPLIVIISLVYSATRHDDWPSILREAFRWGYRMFGFLFAIGVLLYFLAVLGFWPVVFVGGGLFLLGFLLYNGGLLLWKRAHPAGKETSP